MFEEFKKHYMKVCGKTSLSMTEEFHVKQLFDFIQTKELIKVSVNTEKILCPTCQSEILVPV
jgi:hypothetical protein